MASHTIVELPEPQFHIDWDTGERHISNDLSPYPPDWDPMHADEHVCAAGHACATVKVAPLGYILFEHEDGRCGGGWRSPFLIDNRWVVCEDCAGNLEDGSLAIINGQFVDLSEL